MAISTTVLIPRTQGHRSLVTAGGESVGAAPASCAKAPQDEELHQAQSHLETQIWEAGYHLLLVNHSCISTFPKTSEA